MYFSSEALTLFNWYFYNDKLILSFHWRRPRPPQVSSGGSRFSWHLWPVSLSRSKWRYIKSIIAIGITYHIRNALWFRCAYCFDYTQYLLQQTTKETAVEEEGDHDKPLVFTIRQPKTELRTLRPAAGRHNGQPLAPIRGRFDDTAVATTRGRRDSEPKLLLLSFGSSDGWSEASKLQKTMETKKHSAEGKHHIILSNVVLAGEV